MNNRTMGVKKISNYKILIVCAVLVVMAILCGMSEAGISNGILSTVPAKLNTLQGFAVVDQLHL